MNKLVLLIVSIISINTFAQGQYSSSPRYWKNRKPTAAYWQQDVHYTINAKIDIIENVIDASETLVYTNNSPDDLNFVYFHVYQNAFIKDSYLDELYQANNVQTWFGKKLGSGLGTTIENIKVDNQTVKTELDNTILKVYLPQTLKSGAKITITMNFKTYWDVGAIRRRMQIYRAWEFNHLNGVHWYPRISVYDKKKGWDTDQHLNKELYGNFGTFDVNLDFPSNYFVEATGLLQNKQEVFPGDLWEKVQIKNFAKKPWNEAPSTIIPYKKDERKIWKYHADFVHDFAFTADPSYRYQESEIYGVKCVAIVQEPHASRWQNTSEYVTKIIKTFSDDFGMYEYPKIVAADANDGMEYPMLTLDGGADPDNHGLLVHEIGHNWFYGMIGNNETYRAALDEGFTQFATAWGLQKIDGDLPIETEDKRAYIRKHRQKLLVWDRTVLNRYTNDALRGDDKALNTHSNGFNGSIAHENGYSNVYHKTASMLLNLQYVLGDTLFLNAMKHYVEKWKFAHPYFEDFREAIIEYTHVDLNWFFDQWLETTKTIDYSISKIKKKNADNYEISLNRKGEMQMPLDIQVTAKNGSVYNYHIPNTNWFNKSTTATILPKWYGIDILRPNYTMNIQVPSGIKKVQIDPSYRLADVDMSNNIMRKNLFGSSYDDSTSFDFGLRNPASRRAPTNLLRPDLWWNPIDGLKPGIFIEGAYLNYLHKYKGALWVNTRMLTRGFGFDKAFNYQPENGSLGNILPLSYSFTYENPIRAINKKLFWGFHSRINEGLSKHQLFSYWNMTSEKTLRLDFVTMKRFFGATYENYAGQWDSYNTLFDDVPKNNSNNYAQLSLQQNFKSKRSLSRWTNTARVNLPSKYNYAYVQSEFINKRNWKKYDIAVRAFGRAGFGNSIPSESALYLYGANAEEMADNKYTRTNFFDASNFSNFGTDGFANLQMGGGLNIRGFAGYYAVDIDNANTIVSAYKGASGVAINAEIDFDKLIKFAPKFTKNWLHTDLYLFGDAGSISTNKLNITNLNELIPLYNGLGKLRADAGIGTAFTIKYWGKFEKANPLTIRVDFPIAMNSLPANYQYDFISLRRWVIGIGRSF